MTAKTMAEVLHQEGAWCGNCEFEGWDACKDCRDTCEGYARALSAAGFGLVADAKAEALEEAAAIFAGRLPNGTGNGRAYNSYQVADMLRARAAAIRATS